MVLVTDECTKFSSGQNPCAEAKVSNQRAKAFLKVLVKRRVNHPGARIQ
jgi:hypothetical protein